MNELTNWIKQWATERGWHSVDPNKQLLRTMPSSIDMKRYLEYQESLEKIRKLDIDNNTDRAIEHFKKLAMTLPERVEYSMSVFASIAQRRGIDFVLQENDVQQLILKDRSLLEKELSKGDKMTPEYPDAKRQ
ncbi:hypothetical protein P7H15_04730 [Paenibacillus larvae]|nr:hypothetical protein [Paenibacillus larvae]MDT2292353.1 hypothetical protein [Paenibacillus larvae]